MITRIWGTASLILFALTVTMSYFDFHIPAWLWWLDGTLWLGGTAIFVAARGMGFFVLRRLLETVFVIWVIATATFVLLRTLPGGPFDQEKALPPDIKRNIEAKYHLNEPLHKQYLIYMKGLSKGELGQSYKYIGRDISVIIGDSLPASLQLGIYALILSYLIGIPLGVLAGWKRGSALDSGSMFLAISGVSLPSFLMAQVFIQTFGFQGLNWFESAQWLGPEYYFLPVVVLGIRPAAVIARLTRASVLEVIHSDYIRTARAKGLSATSVLFKHVLRNSLIPVLMISGPLAAGILTGSFVIEQIFNVPGVSKHLILSVTNRDYPLILGTTLMFSLMLVLANLVTDILTAVIDPRVKSL